MLNVVMLSVIMLNVVMLSVVMLSAMAPFFKVVINITTKQAQMFTTITHFYLQASLAPTSVKLYCWQNGWQ
jgi:hypothetical protein